MSLPRVSDQKNKTLREFYEEVASDSHASVAAAGRAMILLVTRLEEALRGIPAWGLTSHYHLKLLAADDYRAPWFVSISPPLDGVFVVEYITASQSHAQLSGKAKDVDSAVELIRSAIEKSGGWKP